MYSLLCSVFTALGSLVVVIDRIIIIDDVPLLFIVVRFEFVVVVGNIDRYTPIALGIVHWQGNRRQQNHQLPAPECKGW